MNGRRTSGCQRRVDRLTVISNRPVQQGTYYFALKFEDVRLVEDSTNETGRMDAAREAENSGCAGGLPAFNVEGLGGDVRAALDAQVDAFRLVMRLTDTEGRGEPERIH